MASPAQLCRQKIPRTKIPNINLHSFKVNMTQRNTVPVTMSLLNNSRCICKALPAQKTNSKCDKCRVCNNSNSSNVPDKGRFKWIKLMRVVKKM